MATDIVSSEPLSRRRPASNPRQTGTPSYWAYEVISALASLKLTVVLFALAIVLVFAGTLAQVQEDIWEVVRNYFRTPIAWIDFQVFFPPSFFPGSGVDWYVPGGFYFPGGWTIGGLMFVNLIAAHGLRFKIQARGRQLAAGLGVIALGVALTWLVIAGGDDKAGLDGQSAAPSVALWRLLQLTLAGGWIAIAWWLPKVDPARTWTRWSLIVSGVLLGALLAWLLYLGDEGIPTGPSMRIMWQLIKGGLAAGVLLAGCVLVFRKRAGVVLLHAGILLMMVNELVVHGLHHEGMISLAEGASANYVSDNRTVELAFIDPSPADHENVVVVPKSKLLAGEPVDHELLPVKAEVLEFIQNSNFLVFDRGTVGVASGGKLVLSDKKGTRSYDVGDEADIVMDGKEIALTDLKRGTEVQVYVTAQGKVAEIGPPETPLHVTKGAGLNHVVREVDASTGTDEEAKFDMSSAYVSFTARDGKDLGTYLVSQWLEPQDLQVDGKTYKVALRAKRTYKPYTIQLRDVRKVDYKGTDTPKSFESDIRIVDPTHNVDRNVKIWMNNPLRYGGETFYQSQYFPINGREHSGFQVVTNAGWMTPYVACVIVGAGMLAHFCLTLLRFLRRRAAPVAEMAAPVVEPFKGEKLAGKGARQDRGKRAEGHPSQKTLAARIFPWAIVGVFGAVLLVQARPPKAAEGELDLNEFGKLPVVYGGRVKPFDTLARNTLKIISDKETYKEAYRDGEKEKERTQPAIRWLLDVISQSPAAEEHKVVRIVNSEVLNTFGLEARKGFRYSIAELLPKMEEFEKQVMLAREVEENYRTVFQKQVIELDGRLRTFSLLRAAFRPANLPALPTEEELENNSKAAMEGLGRFQKALAAARQNDALLTAQFKPPLVVPLHTQNGDWQHYAGAWTEDYVKFSLKQPFNPATLYLQDIFLAYRRGNAGRFNKGVEDYAAFLQNEPEPTPGLQTRVASITELARKEPDAGRLSDFYRNLSSMIKADGDQLKTVADVRELHTQAGEAAFDAPLAEKHADIWESVNDLLAEELGPASAALSPSLRDSAVDTLRAVSWSLRQAIPNDVNPTKLGYESFFNHFQPFTLATGFYVIAFVLAALAWLGWSKPLNRAAFWLIILTLALHTFGLVSRIYISGRPPVTNLYSSALFIGWACVVIGIVLEVVYKLGVGNVISAVTGFVMLLIASQLPLDGVEGDTFIVLRAVLDTQFWLATHVVCITLGYATTFLAGGLGVLYILRGVLTPSLTPTVGKELYRMIYGTLCFAIFFSFIGTVLGGLWADDSWGRFWGWDPKENGALMIVLWNALALHARWDGMVKERGLAALAVVGNIVTSWSWFGVNQLGEGLHSYGFTKGVIVALAVFALSQLAIIGMGCIPREKWWSTKAAADAA